MLYCNQIKNFEDFKSRFGYKTGIDGRYLVNANGAKQRKNNIVYLYWKEESLYLHNSKKLSLVTSYEKAHKYSSSKDVFEDMLYSVFAKEITDPCPVNSFDNYELVTMGICLDGDVGSVRYRNISTGKIYKMKIGKYVNKYLDYISNQTNKYFWLKNPTLRIFFIEELTELWKNARLHDKSLHIVINKDFHSIYNPDNRDKNAYHFSSCMDEKENWHFYKDHSNIYDAISLQDDDGLIYARAILVTCLDNNNNEHKYLERIYCNKRMYKDFMFEKAKAEGIFDLYKGLEASCHDATEIYAVKDNKKINYTLHIELNLKEERNYMSYQDTFKWWYKSANKAYNIQKEGMGYSKSLATTEVFVNVND